MGRPEAVRPSAERATTEFEQAHVDPRVGASTPAPDARHAADFVVVANRLPIHPSDTKGGVEWVPSPGGVVTALTSVVRSRRGIWVGSTGESSAHRAPTTFDGLRLRPIQISEEEFERFYLGFSNATLWPLYHDAVRAPTFHREWWHSYCEVNARFASAADEAAAPGATVWIHDYQLQLVPKMLRERRGDVRIGFYLHIPFPPRELFMQLPWRREIVAGLLGADLVGFQVAGAASNFSRLARRLVGARGTDASLTYEGRQVHVGAFPVSVDCDAIIGRAQVPAVVARARQIREDLGNPELVLLGVDRLDYTKGIEQRLRAIAELFDEGRLDPARHAIVQVAVPSREADPHYQDERRQLEQVVSKVNGDFGLVGRPVVHYLHQSIGAEELVAMYLAADVMLVTPFRDGMNLVAKEYVIAHTDLSGRLVLSEFAGAASELRGAFLVNPHDVDALKDVILNAMNADARQSRSRMQRMRKTVQRRDVTAWSASFLSSLHAAASSAGFSAPSE